MKLSDADLLAICPALGVKVNAWVAPINAALDAGQCNTLDRAAMFLAQALHESEQLTRLEENLNYSAAGLLATFPRYFDAQTASVYAHNPQKIANRVYANRMGNGDEASGDGWRNRGRGIFQVTGADNLRELGVALLSSPDALLKNPDLLLLPNYAALSAAWFWGVNQLNDFADRGDFDGVCDGIVRGRKTAAIGDANGYVKRLAGWKLALEILNPTA